jgi:hypothetical protein
MKAMLGISLYSKLVIRAKQGLPGTEEGEKRGGEGGRVEK